VADARMSGQHARIHRQGGPTGAWVLTDLGSTNGTWLNGAPLGRDVPAPLADEDVIAVGHSLFLYRALVDDEGGAAGDRDTADLDSLPPGMATLDPLLARRLTRLERVAASTLSLLLVGETGTGKEVLARAVHTLSGRPGPFVAVNCGAIPHNLVEAHLFGHVRGAFSGAVRDEAGHVRAAQFGTLLLDEIGDLPPSAQAALLRVLQEGEVVPVGSAQPIKVDVRVLGATHRPLEKLVEEGTFRRDLYARLAGYVFALAPLRERICDLGLLLGSFLARGKLTPPASGALRLHHEAARALLAYDWPMNVRELEQCLRASAVLAEEGTIQLADLPAAVAAALAEEPEPAPGGAEADARDEALRRDLLVRLSDAQGNVSEVARAMGKARQQVQRWLRRFRIDPEAYKTKK